MKSNALVELAKPGLAGLPTYEPGRPLETVARDLGLGSVESIVKLASNENALGPSPLALRAMIEAARNMHRYPEGSGFFLRETLAERLGVSVDEILLGNGSNELIELLGHAYLGPDRGLVTADRAFLVYKLVAAVFGAPVIAAPMRNMTYDLDAVSRAISPKTRLLFISNPNNPTGTMVNADAIAAFMDGVPDSVVVAFDEAYVELLPPERQPDTLRYVREGRNVFILRTFSKTYGLAGLRLGYAIAPREGIELLHRLRQPFNVNAMAQAAALAALQDTAHVERTRAMVAEGLDYLGKAMDGLGLVHLPSVTNFMLVRVGDGRKVFEAMMRLRVIVRPMDVYDLPEYIRVTVGTTEENERLVAALAELKEKQVLQP